ncbi:hypothetical protein M406DRAFT_248894 [Cryphonectria parasitica EP155]|uniref:MOZ protein represents a chromatin-associated acetyltransferase n=1 Tax=Cryphonectria parasitica (strain ATCC 38755 / EP155) TaxID=660469 RepID=A0A9P4YBM2_CRYP1|nr:uncharacterized protein M406DRAFT_248894 [Cryphonectria parasitica EP155]KAF3770368.1 hypothetical protein M406DRAFT_248894 [Cryphonectria parasitica EP155]
MSTQRLTFLYPTLFLRSAPSTAGGARRSASRCHRARPRRCPSSSSSPLPLLRPPGGPHQHAAFGTSSTTNKGSFGPRVGKGIEPKPLGDDGSVIPLPPPDARDSTAEQRKNAAKALDPAADALKETLSSPGVSSSERRNKNKEEQETNKGDQATAAGAGQDDGGGAPKKKRATGPMDAVLHMPPPDSVPAEEKPPHLTPAPYVHHFDSYSLVKQLEQNGYTQVQAITAMKAVRALLAQNLDVAQGGLISKSDVENETYLFRAACAELSTEVKNNRRIADEALRQQRTVLQHEVDNTTQVMNQELLTLNDNVRGMFNDRKMAVREEQKKAEGAIQQIAYKISVTLNSDSKSEIEAVRWVVTRRAVAGIIFMVIFSLGVLRYSSYISHENQKEAQKEKEEIEVVRKSGGKIDRALGPDAAEILAAN